MAEKESYLKQYQREVRAKRREQQRDTSMDLKTSSTISLKSLADSAQDTKRLIGTKVGDKADSGQPYPKANEDGSFKRSDVRRGLEAQRNVAATQESGRQIQLAVSKQGNDIAGSIQQLGLRLEDAMFRANNRLIKELGKMQGGGGRRGGLFGGGGIGRDDFPGGGGNGNNQPKGRSKWGSRLKMAGGALAGGGLGYLAGTTIADAMGSQNPELWGAGAGVAGSIAGGVLTSEGGMRGLKRVGGAIARRPGAALGTAGALAAGGYAGMQAYNNAGVLMDGNATGVDKLRAGSHLALSGVGGFIGHKLGGVKGAAMGAAAGDMVADAGEWIGEKINNVISGSRIGDAVQNAVGTGIDTAMAPFSEEARERLAQTFSSTIDSAKAAALDVAGYVSGLSSQAQSLYGSFKASIGDASTTAATVIRSGITTAEEVAAKLPSLTDIGGKAAGLVTAAGATTASVIGKGFSGASELFSADVRESFAPSIDFAAKAIGDSVTTFQSWFSDWGSKFTMLKDSLANNFEDFKQGASQFVKGAAQGFAAGAQQVADAAKMGFIGASGGGGGGAGGSGGGSPSTPSSLPAGSASSQLQGPAGKPKTIPTDVLNAASDAANAVSAGPIGSRGGMTAKELAQAKSDAASKVMRDAGYDPSTGKALPSAAPAQEKGVIQKAIDTAKGVGGAITAGAMAVPAAASTAKNVALSAGAAEGAQKMGSAVMGSLQALSGNYRNQKHDFSGIQGGDMLKSHGSYTEAEAAKIRELKTSGANTSANLKGGMSAETRDKIISAAYASGQDPKTMLKMAAMESGGNPNAVSMTGATGIYQFTGKTATGSGVADRFNEDQNIAGGMKLTAANKAILEKKGLPTTPENLYMMHQLGPQAASEVIAGARDGKNKGDLSAATQKAMNLNYGKNSATAKDYLATNAKALDDRYKKVVGGGDEAIVALGAKGTQAGVASGATAKAEEPKGAPLGTIQAKTEADRKQAEADKLKGTKVAQAQPGAGGSGSSGGGGGAGGMAKEEPVQNKVMTATPQRAKIAQDMNPELFKGASSATAKGPEGSVGLQGSKSYHVQPVAMKPSAMTPEFAEKAKARPTEFERIREKPQMPMVEIANMPDTMAGSDRGPNHSNGMVQGRTSPNIDEIPMMITDMGLVLLQMGHT